MSAGSRRRRERPPSSPPPPVRKRKMRCERTGKVRFLEAEDAVAALARASRRARPAERAYRCPFCADWHLTSQPKRGRWPPGEAGDVGPSGLR